MPLSRPRITGLWLAAGALLSGAAPTPQKDPAPAAEPPRITLNVSAGREQTVNLGYRFRWDGRDLRGLPRFVGRFTRNPFRGMHQLFRGADYGAQLSVYGLRFTDRWESDKTPEGRGEVFREGTETTLGPRRKAALDRKRLRAELTRGLRRGLIDQSVERALPATRQGTHAQRETIALDLWRAGETWGLLPGNPLLSAPPGQQKQDPLEPALQKIRDQR